MKVLIDHDNFLAARSEGFFQEKTLGKGFLNNSMPQLSLYKFTSRDK